MIEKGSDVFPQVETEKIDIRKIDKEKIEQLKELGYIR